jgi:hypothetical protein
MTLEEAGLLDVPCIVDHHDLIYLFFGDGTIHVVLDEDWRVCEKDLFVQSWTNRLKYRLPFQLPF